MINQNKLILASGSPRRAQLLKELGYNFTVEPTGCAETSPKTVPPSKLASYLAQKKCDFISKINKNTIYLTADTVVIINNTVLGKPNNPSEATEMLKKLSNKTHTVVTAVGIKTDFSLKIIEDKTNVTFKKLTNDEISYYIDTFKPYDKAGAYAIQEWIGLIGITKIEGCYYNVMGLPCHKVKLELDTRLI